MSYYDAPISRFDKDGENRTHYDGFNEEIDRAKNSRNTPFKDTDIQMVDKDYLGVDNLDKMRRRKIK